MLKLKKNWILRCFFARDLPTPHFIAKHHFNASPRAKVRKRGQHLRVELGTSEVRSENHFRTETRKPRFETVRKGGGPR